MYEEILVPTDGSPAAAEAVEHAVVVADRFDAALRVLYVVDASVYSTMDAGVESVLQAMEREGREALDRVRAAAESADVPVTDEIVRGRVHRTITNRAAETGADLIVMGTHGRRGLNRYLLGSVTERVVRTADQPVLTVRHAGDDEDRTVEPVAIAPDDGGNEAPTAREAGSDSDGDDTDRDTEAVDDAARE